MKKKEKGRPTLLGNNEACLLELPRIRRSAKAGSYQKVKINGSQLHPPHPRDKKYVEDNISIMRKIWTKGEGKAFSGIGASRGLLTWWDKERYSLRSTIENRNWLFIEIENKQSKEVL